MKNPIPAPYLLGGLIWDNTPVRYTGKAVLCVKCDKLLKRFAMPNNVYCRCRHDVRQLETEETAQERRAHWVLKQQFDPTAHLTKEYIIKMMDEMASAYGGARTGRFSAKGKSK